MPWKVCLYNQPAVTADGRRCRLVNAANYTGIVGDTRSFMVLASVDIMSPSWAPASRATGNPSDTGVIELYGPLEKPSDVPATNFVPWTN